MAASAATGKKYVFFDCDDCLYKNDWRTATLLTAKIDEYTQNVLGLPAGKAYDLYLQYGTALRGLVEEKLIEEKDVEAFLQHVHDINLDDIKPDPSLRALIQAIPYPRWVFTASIREHAERCLERLGIQDLFLGIISASSEDMIRKVGYARVCVSAGVLTIGLAVIEVDMEPQVRYEARSKVLQRSHGVRRCASNRGGRLLVFG
jgi:pyrimidine 5'-nucleotidase